MKELQKGVYIAQGPETNVLIRLSGKAPMLEVTTAIDLNAFYNKGKIVELALNSAEIIDIMSYPENYVFYEPAVSDSVYNKEGLESFKGKEEVLNFISAGRKVIQNIAPISKIEPIKKYFVCLFIF